MDKSGLLKYLDEIDQHVEMAHKVWENPETAGNEKQSADLYREVLKENGFKLTELKEKREDLGNAFIAEYGKGYPVIAVLGEYDALPGLSQKIDTKHSPIEEGAPGHGCGHNLLGAAGLGAVLGIKKYLDESKQSGTIRFYGSPEEETLVGKVKMAKAGAFEGCDIALSWHPMNVNAPVRKAFLANNSIKFRFNGVSSHAAQAPESGRSALDAVELMNVGANYLREHIIDKARVHYTITNAGGAPNIVPKEAESWYFVRSPKRKDVEEITERLIKISEGAGLMTETDTEYEVLGGCYEYLTNETLFDLTYENMEQIEKPSYTDEELKFAEELQKSLRPDLVKGEVEKFTSSSDDNKYIYEGLLEKEDTDSVVVAGSSESGDVSWLMPMNVFMTATWPLGVPPHSWQATAASGSTIGIKGMQYSAKIFAAMAYDLLNDNSLVEKAKEEFNERTKNEKYVSALDN